MSTAFVDFAALKQQVSIAQVVSMLGLTMKTNGEQMRGACPQCRAGGDRALAVNTGKSSYYCFADKKGGDSIALCAHITGKSPREAAVQIATHFKFVGNSSGNSAPSGTVPAQAPSPAKKPAGFNADAYLASLDPASEALASLGISANTLKAFRAGYSKTGLNRGRLALAVCDREGTILAFCGRTVGEETPRLIFPNGFKPEEHIYAAERVATGPLYLVRDPLQVLNAFESGIENVVAFLTETFSPQQLEMLASLMDQKKCESVELY